MPYAVVDSGNTMMFKKSTLIKHRVTAVIKAAKKGHLLLKHGTRGPVTPWCMGVSVCVRGGMCLRWHSMMPGQESEARAVGVVPCDLESRVSQPDFSGFSLFSQSVGCLGPLNLTPL